MFGNDVNKYRTACLTHGKVCGKGEFVSNICFSAAEDRGVNGNSQGLVSGLLRTAYEVQGHFAVLQWCGRESEEREMLSSFIYRDTLGYDKCDVRSEGTERESTRFHTGAVNGKRRDVVYVKGRLQHGAKITVRLL